MISPASQERKEAQKALCKVKVRDASTSPPYAVVHIFCCSITQSGFLLGSPMSLPPSSYDTTCCSVVSSFEEEGSLSCY